MSHDHEDAEQSPVEPVTDEPVFFRGPPLETRLRAPISHNRRLNHTSMPIEYKTHPLIEGRFFYTIPSQLLRLVFEGEVGESLRFDRQLYELEIALSTISGDHSNQIGFWRELPVLFPLMEMPPIRVEDLMRIGLSRAKATAAARDISARSTTFAEISGAYCGWLMTNSTFLLELDALLGRFSEQVRRWGTAMVGLPIPRSFPTGFFNPTGEPGWSEYESAVLEFCVRWRLQGLAGPRIPVPMKPMMSGQFPVSIVQQLMRAGGVFNWPDTVPLFARDVLRDMLADALRPREATGHLEGWQEIIRVDNRARNQFAGLERRFRLQHFWRILRQRHPGIFHRRLTPMQRAFATFFGVDESSIRADRLAIQKSLGKDWDQRVELA